MLNNHSGSVYVGGKRLTLMLDTGTGPIILYQRKVRGRISMRKIRGKKHIRHLGGTALVRQIFLQGVAMGPERWSRLSAYLLDVPTSQSGPDGVLGVASLDLAELNLDFQRNVVSWRLSDDPGEE